MTYGSHGYGSKSYGSSNTASLFKKLINKTKLVLTSILGKEILNFKDGEKVTMLTQQKKVLQATTSTSLLQTENEKVEINFLQRKNTLYSTKDKEMLEFKDTEKIPIGIQEQKTLPTNNRRSTLKTHNFKKPI